MSENAWIEWSGGPMPVAGDVLVDIKCRCDEVAMNNPASLWSGTPTDWWKHEAGLFGNDQDIIAYRLSGPSA